MPAQWRAWAGEVGMLSRLALALFAGCSCAQAADYTALFDATWSTVNDNFYDPAFHGVDWKAVGATA